MNEHIHSFKKVQIEPTCRENGYTLYRCDCGFEQKSNFVPAGKHLYQLTSKTEPACATPGEKIFRCSACGETVNETIAPLGHMWGNWITQVMPTCTEDGCELRICARCGAREERATEPTGHKLVSRQPSKNEKAMDEGFCENCGQTVLVPRPKKSKKLMISLISIAAVLCFAVAAWLIMRPNE